MRHQRKNRPLVWFKILGLLAALALLAVLSVSFKHSILKIGQILRPRPHPSLADFQKSLDSLSAQGWQIAALPGSSASGWQLSIPAPSSFVLANLKLHRLAQSHGLGVDSVVEDRQRAAVTMYLNMGDSLAVKLALRKKAVLKSPEQYLPDIALVVYESGVSGKRPSQHLLGCPAFKTLALAERKDSTDLDFLNLLPLEPKGYPQQDPGPGTILVDESPSSRRSKIMKCHQLNPQAKGFYIRFGSRAVEDPAVVAQLVDFCREQGLIIVEPVPTSASLVASLAKTRKVPYYKADLYLKPSATYAEAQKSLMLAAGLATKNGRAIICLPGSQAVLKAAAEFYAAHKERFVFVSITSVK